MRESVKLLKWKSHKRMLDSALGVVIHKNGIKIYGIRINIILI